MDFPALPIGGHQQADFYKLYLADTGLLMAQLDRDSQEDVRVRRDLGTWNGGFFENVVAEALVKAQAIDPSITSADQLIQDEGALDTWFSSWLWPVSLFDGINNIFYSHNCSPLYKILYIVLN